MYIVPYIANVMIDRYIYICRTIQKEYIIFKELITFYLMQILRIPTQIHAQKFKSTTPPLWGGVAQLSCLRQESFDHLLAEYSRRL